MLTGEEDTVIGSEASLSSSAVITCVPVHCPKDSPPSKMVNAADEMDVSGDHVLSSSRTVAGQQQRVKPAKILTGTATGQSRTAKVTVRANRVGINRLKPKLASTLTSTGVVGTSVSGETKRKSASPQPQAKGTAGSSIIGVVHNTGSSSPTPSGVSVGTSGGESVHTQDLDAETIDQSQQLLEICFGYEFLIQSERKKRERGRAISKARP